jgi:hypothetical protein
MASDTQSPLTETWDQIDRQFRFLIDRVLAQHGPDKPEMSLVMTCPEYPDSPIIAAMQGFENVCGRPIQTTIGRNCRFLNKGMQNDPETMKELREIQASPQAARQYMKQYPRGKQFLLLNARPCRMLPDGVTMNPDDPDDPDPATMVYFYNCLTIFAIEIKHDGRKTVVFIGLQCVLHNGMDVKTAETHTKHIQDALTHPHKGVRHIFYHWCRVALGMYQEFHEWNVDGHGSPSPLTSGIKKSVFGSSNSSGSSSERSLSRESPKNCRGMRSGTPATTAEWSGSQTQSQSMSGGWSESQGQGASGSAEWSGSQQSHHTQTSSGGRTIDCSSSNGSETGDVAECEKEDAAEYAEGSVKHAQALLKRVRECERMAMLWAENNEEEERDSRVQELVDLRVELCDDFASDIQLYIAYHSLHPAALEREVNESTAACA